MPFDRQLKHLFEVIRQEAARNPQFKESLDSVFSGGAGSNKTASSGVSPKAGLRRGNRRAASVIDPISEVKQGERHLENLLSSLTLDQLRDVVAEYRMDPSKLVMKWQDRERVIRHIITTAVSRENKGDAFRS